jgi:acetyl esterase/lipase
MREHIDPQLARIVSMMPVVDLSDVQKIRALNMSTQMPVSASDRLVSTQEHIVPRNHDASDTRVRVYRPHGSDETLPAIIYCHPGLFFGTLEMDHARCMRFASEVHCVVVAVDYRLAPEHRFPAGLEDCYDTLCWIASNPSSLNIDPARIAVAGCSTGATLAAALALLARERGGPAIAFQLLVCPTLDDRLETPSMQEYKDAGPMEAGKIGSAHTWRYYLGDDRSVVSPLAAPARAASLVGLPPALVITAEYDCVRDEGIDYALRLVRAGVPCELHHFPGCFHAFDFVARTAAVSKRALDEQVAVLRRVFDIRRAHPSAQASPAARERPPAATTV